MHDLSLSLSHHGSLHKAKNAHVLDQVLNIFLFLEVVPCLLKFLIGDPLLPIVGPILEEILLAATAAIGRECHQPVAKIPEPEAAPIIDALNDLVVIVPSIAIFAFFFVGSAFLKVQLLQHALVKNERLIVTDQHRKGRSNHSRVPSQVTQDHDQ